jgi:hypothetical protein
MLNPILIEKFQDIIKPTATLLLPGETLTHAAFGQMAPNILLDIVANRSAWLAASESLKTSATSGSSSTTFVHSPAAR